MLSYLITSSTLSVSNERMVSLGLQPSFLMRLRISIMPVLSLAPRQIFVERLIFSRVHEEVSGFATWRRTVALTSLARTGALNDIGDARNVILLYLPLHNQSESRLAAILKTPDRALRTDDVIEDSMVASNTHLHYPENARYTLTWLVHRGYLQGLYGHGMFGSIDEATVPSALVLHYVYGATALERWGRNDEPFMARGRSSTLVRAKAYEAEEALKAEEDKDEDEDIPIADQLMMRLAYGSKREAREKAESLWRHRMEGWCNETDVALHPTP